MRKVLRDLTVNRIRMGTKRAVNKVTESTRIRIVSYLRKKV